MPVGAAAEQPDPNVALVRDEQQRAVLRAMMNRLPAVVVITGGPEHRLQYLNEAAMAVFGERARIGVSLPAALPELRGQELLTALDRVQVTGEPVQLDQTSLSLPGRDGEAGEERFFTLLVQPLRDPAGTLLGSVLHAVEITSQIRARRAAETLARENAALYAEANAVLGLRDELLNTLAHDLRAPLTAIQAGLQLLERQIGRDGPLDRERVAAVTQPIGAAATRLNGMLSELEDLARVQAGQPLELHRAPTDLGVVVAQAVAMQRLGSQQHEIVVEAPEAALVGQWDAARLERAITNLLGNAVRYSPAGGTIRLSIGLDAAGDEALVTVADRGIGIPAADLPRVFERFYRSPAVANRIRGNGLGLASVREIVEQHGGRVEIASVEGEGTTVTIHLPRH
ncbi:MAG TPA: ATP-binding protein [Dehalococcoidia bacterium]|nr:ATP-binding protein [Dehalococcoidia bacterium]